jgi:2-dehydro-3-deoxygluconokinase
MIKKMNKKSKIICFGEILIRLNPKDYKRFFQAESFDISFAGSEANVGVMLANLGLDVSFFSSITNNEIGQSAINSLRKYGVGTDLILRDNHRLGVYYVEMGYSQRPSKVIYDRKYSGITQIEINDLDWDQIFGNANWFHFSGITPALSENLENICEVACKEAKKRNITISFDLNYRSQLWDLKKAKKVINKLLNYVDICICNEEDFIKFFSFENEGSFKNYKIIDYDGYVESIIKIFDNCNFKYVAVSLRESISANENNWSGVISDGNTCSISKKYKINVLDRIGTGDSFAAGIIYSMSKNYSMEKCVNFATAASCLKHTIYQDFNIISEAEILSLMKGDDSGRVKR